MAPFNTPFNTPLKKANKKELFITLGVVGAIVIGTLGYYLWPNSDNGTNEAPPSITISTQKFQGLISGDVVCQIPGMYEFTDSAVSGYKMPGVESDLNWNNLEQGIHMYHSVQPIHVKEIVDAIKPVAGNKIMIAYYPSDDGNVSKKFAIYPELPEQTKITDPASYLIPGNQGFAIFSCKDTKIWQVKTEKMAGSAISGLLKSKTKGWILLAATDQPLATSLAAYKNKIKSIWLQKDAGFEFQKAASLESATLVGGYKMVWLKIGPEEGGEKPKSTDVKVFLAPKTADKTVNGGDTIELATFTLFSESKASIKKITLRQNGNINANYIENIELLSSKNIEQGLLKDLTPVTHKLEKVDTKSFALNFDPNTLVIDNSYLYLQIKTKTPSESVFGGATYNIGLEKVSDVQLYETDRTVVPFNDDFKTPAYGNLYTIATSIKLGKPKNFVVDTAAPQTNATAIKVKWELPEETKTVDIKNYHLKYGTGTQTGANIVKDQTDLSANSTFALAQNLIPNTDYWFSIAAIDLKGVEGEAATLTAKTETAKLLSQLETCNKTCYTTCNQPPNSEAYKCPTRPTPIDFKITPWKSEENAYILSWKNEEDVQKYEFNYHSIGKYEFNDGYAKILCTSISNAGCKGIFTAKEADASGIYQIIDLGTFILGLRAVYADESKSDYAELENPKDSTTKSEQVIKITSCQYDPVTDNSGLIIFNAEKEYNYKLEYKYFSYVDNSEKSSTIDIHPINYDGSYSANNFTPFAQIIEDGEVALYNLSGYPSTLRMLPSSGKINYAPTDWCNSNK